MILLKMLCFYQRSLISFLGIHNLCFMEHLQLRKKKGHTFRKSTQDITQSDGCTEIREHIGMWESGIFQGSQRGSYF